MPRIVSAPKILPTPPFCLTIAGLDPTGGAGATADLRVFRRVGVYGLSAFTALTPQNTRGVIGIHPVSKEALQEELQAVFSDFPVAAMKTGQIPNRELALVIAKALEKTNAPLVIDPVMLPTRGRWLVEKEAVGVLRDTLLPRAALITPNLGEAAFLVGHSIGNRAEMERAARELVPAMTQAVVLTAGDGLAEGAWDLFYDGTELHWLKTRRRAVGDVHGSGCHHSAAIAAYLARGESLIIAVRSAKKLLTHLIDKALIDPTGQMKIIHS